jgi:hypothetical protein
MVILNLLASLENQVKIASLGGIEVIISAMKLHGDHKDIQLCGCRALAYLAVNSGWYRSRVVALTI